MATTSSDLNRLQGAVARTLHAHWRLFLTEGVLLLVLGLAAVAIPPIATIAVEILLGWLILFSGVIGLVATFRTRGAPGFGWSLASALLGIVVGVMLLRSPLRGALTLTLILTVFFFIEGVASIFYALAHKRELSGRWAWMLFSGLIDLFLAGVILMGLPGTAAWAIGLLVGINMVFGGTALIGMALKARSPDSGVAAPLR